MDQNPQSSSGLLEGKRCLFGISHPKFRMLMFSQQGFQASSRVEPGGRSPSKLPGCSPMRSSQAIKPFLPLPEHIYRDQSPFGAAPLSGRPL